MCEPTQLYNQLSSRQYRFLPRTTLFNFGRVLFYFFCFPAPIYVISFSTMWAIFLPRGHCLLCVQMHQFRNIFFFLFFTWETCLDFNMCRPAARGIVVCIIGHESLSQSTRRSESRTDRFCADTKGKKYNIITLEIMAIICKVYANYYGAWHCIIL